MTLEYVVRPFQSPGSQGTTIIPSTPSRPSDKAILTWGASAVMPPVKGINFQVVCCKEESDEKSRESDRLQIMGNDNESYIWVQRASQLKLNKSEKNSCGDDWDQFSGIGLEITGALAEFAADIHSGTAAGDANPTQCEQTWKLNNNTTAG
jgi:hypothetical protein